MVEVSHSNAEELIKGGKKRTVEQNFYYIKFLNEQRTTHRAQFLSEDKEYKRRCVQEQEREVRAIKRRKMQQAREEKRRRDKIITFRMSWKTRIRSLKRLKQIIRMRTMRRSPSQCQLQPNE